MKHIRIINTDTENKIDELKKAHNMKTSTKLIMHLIDIFYYNYFWKNK